MERKDTRSLKIPDIMCYIIIILSPESVLVKCFLGRTRESWRREERSFFCS